MKASALIVGYMNMNYNVYVTFYALAFYALIIGMGRSRKTISFVFLHTKIVYTLTSLMRSLRLSRQFSQPNVGSQAFPPNY